jgi:magnesium chelatase family protein
MFAKVFSSTILGIEAFPVEVEAHLSAGKNNIRIVGLPDGILRESRERVRCAIFNSGFKIPNGEVVVSLAPADLPKTGSGFDLAVALAILASDGQIDSSSLRGRLFLGELALNGRLKPVSGALSTALLCKKMRDFLLVVAEGTCAEAGLVSGVEIETAASLAEVASALIGERPLRRSDWVRENSPPWRGAGFGDVRGQFAAKRALEICAAGGHNLLLVGPPGSGKSMLAERLCSILPALTNEELLEVCRIYDSSHDVELGESTRRPFRAPHHTTSLAGLVGGGPGPRPGEISLAHKGILFLDELPEFRRDALESLRQPIESRRVSLSRANRRLIFPADFTLLAAMNACPCGKRGMIRELCRCTPAQITRYLSRVSGPILDRIDLQLWVQPVGSSELFSTPVDDPTEGMRRRVLSSQEIQRKRNKGRLNSRVSSKELERISHLDDIGVEILRGAVEKLKLSARSYSRALKVGRTIADIAGSEVVKSEHISEALSYRLNLNIEG